MPDEEKTIETAPSPNGDGAGRRKNGKFAKGNTFATGDPFAKHRQRFRASFIRVAEKRFPKIARRLMAMAEKGDEWAVREVLDRLMGTVKAEPVVVASPPPFQQQNNVFLTMSPEQQARIDELAKIGLATIAAEGPIDVD